MTLRYKVARGAPRTAARGDLRWLWWSTVAIGVDIGLARLGYGLVLPAIRNDIAGGYAAFGIVATTHFIGYLAGTLSGPPIMSRIKSAAKVAVWAHVAVAFCLAASAASWSSLTLGATRTLLGLASGVGILAVVTAAMERVPAAERAKTSGRLWAGIALGLILSSLATPWMLSTEGGWRLGTLVAAAVGAAAALGMSRTFGSPSAADGPATVSGETDFRVRELLQPGRYLFLAIAYSSYGAAYTAYSTFIIAALRARAVGAVALAAIWTAFGIAALVGALYVGRVMFGRLKSAAFPLALVAGSIGTLVTAIPVGYAALAGAIGVGLGLAATPAIVTALVRMRCSAATTANAFAAVTVIFGMGQVVGPATAGALADRFGPGSVPWVAASFYTVAALAALVDAFAQRRDVQRRGRYARELVTVDR